MPAAYYTPMSRHALRYRCKYPDGPKRDVDTWNAADAALNALGDRDRFMALLKAHLLNYISPDLFYAYESVTLHTTPRFAYSDWCIPAQLARPRMLLHSFSSQLRDGTVISFGGPAPETVKAFEKNGTV